MDTESETDVGTLKTATAVRRSVTRLARRLRLERAGHGVSSSKLIALGELMRGGPMTATALAMRQHLQPQSLTRVLADLKGRGLIQQEQAETDRRQVSIEITQKGRDLLVQDALQEDAWLSRVMATTLTEPEREMLNIAARLLTRLSDEPRSGSEPGGDQDEGAIATGAAPAGN